MSCMLMCSLYFYFFYLLLAARPSSAEAISSWPFAHPRCSHISLCWLFVVAHVCLRAPGAVEQSRSVSWLHGVKSDLNQTTVALDLVLLMLVVFIDCCLGFFSVVVIWL